MPFQHQICENFLTNTVLFLNCYLLLLPYSLFCPVIGIEPVAFVLVAQVGLKYAILLPWLLRVLELQGCMQLPWSI